MTITYVKIASVAVGVGGSASIDFSSIPATYTDLLVKVSARGNGTGTTMAINVRFNGSSAANYSYRALQGSGAAAISYTSSGGTSCNIGNGAASSSTANTFNSTDIYIPNYLSSNAKSISFDDANETNAATAYATLTAGLWNQTAAINQITLADYSSSTSFVQYSSATLYGIKSS